MPKSIFAHLWLQILRDVTKFTCHITDVMDDMPHVALMVLSAYSLKKFGVDSRRQVRQLLLKII